MGVGFGRLGRVRPSPTSLGCANTAGSAPGFWQSFLVGYFVPLLLGWPSTAHGADQEFFCPPGRIAGGLLSALLAPGPCGGVHVRVLVYGTRRCFVLYLYDAVLAVLVVV
jgi:hypothetical protein